MATPTKKTVKALATLIVICFIGLVVTSFMLVKNHSKLRELRSQKKVLIEQLAEEVLARQRLQKHLDSLVQQKKVATSTVEDSSTLVELIPKGER